MGGREKEKEQKNSSGTFGTKLSLSGVFSLEQSCIDSSPMDDVIIGSLASISKYNRK